MGHRHLLGTWLLGGGVVRFAECCGLTGVKDAFEVIEYSGTACRATALHWTQHGGENQVGSAIPAGVLFVVRRSSPRLTRAARGVCRRGGVRV